MKQIVVTVTPFDMGLVCIGLIMMSVGLYRMVPIPLKGMLIYNLPLLVILLIFGAVMYTSYKPSGLLDVTKITMMRAIQFLPLMVLLCAVMGIGAVITKWNEPAIQRFIENHHIVGTVLASLLTPTSNALIPIVESSWKVKALQPWCLYYLQASAMMSIPLYMLRSTGFTPGLGIGLRMYVSGCILSLIMLIFARPIFAMVELVMAVIK